MITRYTRPEMGRIWSEENRFGMWMEVEIAACEAQAQLGRIPARAAQVIRKKAAFSVERVNELKLACGLCGLTCTLASLRAAGAPVPGARTSGAVAAYPNIAAKAGPRPSKTRGRKAHPASNQTQSRDRHAEFMATLAVVASSLD